MPIKKGGRPASYSPGLVAEAISLSEARSGTATLEDVKEILFTDLGVKRSVRPESLDAEVRAQVAEHQRARDDRCIARLPEAVCAEIDEAVLAVARTMALACGRYAERSEAALKSRLEEEGRLRLELVRRLAEVEAERDHALGQCQTSEQALEAMRQVVGSRDRKLAQLEKRLTRLEGVLEGLRGSASQERSAGGAHGEVTV